MKIELIPPQSDKSYSIHFTEFSSDEVDDIRGKILNSFRHKDVKNARPFLQGDSSDWKMVEFWTNDKDLIFIAFGYYLNLFTHEKIHH